MYEYSTTDAQKQFSSFFNIYHYSPSTNSRRCLYNKHHAPNHANKHAPTSRIREWTHTFVLDSFKKKYTNRNASSHTLGLSHVAAVFLMRAVMLPYRYFFFDLRSSLRTQLRPLCVLCKFVKCNIVIHVKTAPLVECEFDHVQRVQNGKINYLRLCN